MPSDGWTSSGRCAPIEREVFLEGQLERTLQRTSHRSQSGPEQTVVDNQQIDSARDCHIVIVESEASTAAPILLTSPEFSICESIERVWEIADLRELKEFVGITNQRAE